MANNATKIKNKKFIYQYQPKNSMATPFRQVIEFFDTIGLFDVVLPFLLVFTIVFAILEKTKVLGTEEIDGKKYTKKNLNAIASFVINHIASKAVEFPADDTVSFSFYNHVEDLLEYRTPLRLGRHAFSEYRDNLKPLSFCEPCELAFLRIKRLHLLVVSVGGFSAVD